MSELLYRSVSPTELGEFYTRHVDAMTRERLVDKGDIAVQLAIRDRRIAELEAVGRELSQKLHAATAELIDLWEK